MKKLLTASVTCFLGLHAAAWALDQPTPGAKDKRICDVNYDANNVLNTIIRVGDNVVIRPGLDKTIVDTAPSDSSRLANILSNDKTEIFIKAMAGMQTQPFFFRAQDVKDPTKVRDYALQLTAIDPLIKAAKGPVQEASIKSGDIKSDDLKEDPIEPLTCYIIRYNYPTEVSPQAVAAWKARQAKVKADADEVALRKAQDNKQHNVRYMSQGDSSILPTEVWDDGDSTWMTFPGNRTLPVIYEKQPDNNQDDATLGTTVEQGGVVKIHGTAPFFRLRSGDLVACLFNLAYDATGTNPGTGTTTQTIERAVGGR